MLKLAVCEKGLTNACDMNTAHWLLQKGSDALARASHRGMPIDIKHVRETRKKLRKEADDLERETLRGPTGADWRKKYGSAAGFSKPIQVEDVLFNLLGLKSISDIKDQQDDGDGDGGAGKDILEELEHPLANAVLRWRKLDKTEDFLAQIEREVVDGVLHPNYSLNIPTSYRSSGSDPNPQNWPARDEEMSAHVRNAFRAPKGWRFVERDFKGIEVAVACCYHLDPVMMRYLADKKSDMHRDVSCDCYLLDPADVGKRTRYSGKNGFTFPEFYGSYWRKVAPSLWRNIRKLKLKRERDGVCLYAHLKGKEITELGDCSKTGKPAPGTFAHHIRAVECRFWKDRLRVYDQWRRDWYDLYCQRGHFRSVTGFTYSGHYRRNQVINLPVQGSAFHCLLRGFILVTDRLAKTKMKSYLCGQIHDSAIALVPDSEYDDYNQLAEQIMVVNLKKDWNWIVTPIEVEVEASPSGGTWFEKKEVRK